MRWSVWLVLAFCTLLPFSPALAMEQAVIVHFQYGSTDLTRLYDLEDEIEAAIKSSDAGEYDGHEIAIDASAGTLFMYGLSADRLLDVVMPLLRNADFMEGAQVVRRYGPADSGAREVSTRVESGPHP